MINHCHHKCEHKEVKFCKDCKAVYCASCKEEWFEKCTLNHYNTNWYYTTPTFPQITSGTVPGNLKDIYYTTSCSHDLS